MKVDVGKRSVAWHPLGGPAKFRARTEGWRTLSFVAGDVLADHFCALADASPDPDATLAHFLAVAALGGRDALRELLAADGRLLVPTTDYPGEVLIDVQGKIL